MKIALGFWGITRSLKFTYQSINEKIFKVLKKNNIDYDIFQHTYTINSIYKNKRAKEYCENYDNEEYKILKADYLEIDNQDEIKKELNLLKYRTHKDTWNSNYNSTDNYIIAMYSKHKLVNLINNNFNNYDFIIFLRPDVEYQDVLNINYFNLIKSNTICIPNFHCFTKYKLNDRFAICHPNNYKIYGDIFKFLLPLSKIMSLNSELILGIILEKYNIKIFRIKILFLRVRINGKKENI